jgi:hypothetical protein
MTLDDLKKFCADDDSRLIELREPFTRGAYTYATNGEIAVRVPAIEGVAELPPKMLPKLEELFSDSNETWQKFAFTHAPSDVECNICHGYCEHECNCGHIHECDNCNGKGKVPVRSYDYNTKIGNSFFQDRYLALINGWEIAPHPTDPLGAAYIRRDGASGVLMPIREE